MRYAVWYDNSSGYFEAFKVVEADDPATAISLARQEKLANEISVVVTIATSSAYGFGDDPNRNASSVIARSLTA